jgi:glycosyltransferase involved in cell wall biosynthesis
MPSDRPSDAAQAITAVVVCMTDAERTFIGDALASVISQTVACKTVVYVDERSSWSHELQAAFPAIALRRIPLQSLGAVRNVGAQEAGTTWLAFLDGDDVWEHRKIERQLAVAREGVDLVGTDYVLIDESGRRCGYGLNRYIPAPSTWLVRRETMLRWPFAPEAKYEDSAWWQETRGKVNRVRLPEVHVRYRVRSGSLSQGTPGRRRKARVVALARSPLLRPAVLAGTYAAWRLCRSERYVD